MAAVTFTKSHESPSICTTIHTIHEKIWVNSQNADINFLKSLDQDDQVKSWIDKFDIKYKDKNGKKAHVFTLNNTACASPRILIPLLENHQNRDGSINIPKCLQKYMNNKDKITV